MEYPYLEIYECLHLCGLEEASQSVLEGELRYEVKAGEEEEFYMTDNNVFYLYSANHKKFTPYWPHACWDHLFYLLKSWSLIEIFGVNV